MAAGSLHHLPQLRVGGEPVRNRSPLLRPARPRAGPDDALGEPQPESGAGAPDELPRLVMAGRARPYATFGLIVLVLLFRADDTVDLGSRTSRTRGVS